MLARPGTKAMLLRNPRYREWAMADPERAEVATTLGGMMGLGASRGVDWLRQFLNDMLADLPGGDAPGPQSALPPARQFAGASDITGELPPRVQQSRPEIEMQRELARRLMAG
jgi:hypothetical protein